MDELTGFTSELKEALSRVVDYKDKEELILKHLTTVKKLNYFVEDIPENLDWFNTTQPLSSDDLKGKIVVLDFFTYCCINCLHVIPHIRQLEENYSIVDGLVVIGVHSAKFDNEKDSQNILLALQRHNITHPVVNDKNCHMWTKLNISCWPTIVIIDPDRQPLFVLVGEGHKNELSLFVKVTLKFYKDSILSHQLPVIPCDQIITSSLLSFPGKISQWGNLFAVSDSGNHRIVIIDKDGHIKYKIGGKNSGFKDGNFETSRFNSPQGLVFYTSSEIYIADTGNHAIRLINLEIQKVITVVGTGEQGTDYEGGKVGTLQELSSPWDVCIVPCSDVEIPVAGPFIIMPPIKGGIPPTTCGPPPPPPPLGFPPPLPLPSGDFPDSSKTDCGSSKVLLIAAAGTHQIWAYFVEAGIWWKGRKFEKNSCVAIAGSGKEENRNNLYPMMASFAQPSGLSYSSELKSVFIADSESSSIRKLSLKDGVVSHVAGGAKSPNDLFSFGDKDGKAHEAKLQHPLGVVWSSKRNCLFVCDTYNHKVKVIDVSSSHCKSLSKSKDLFNEPGGACLNESEDLLYICDTNNNCVKVIKLSDGSLTKLEIQEPEVSMDTLSKDIWEGETILSSNGGSLTLKIEFTPKEIHGKWSLQLDETKIKSKSLKGKFESNIVEFNFGFLPSETDDPGEGSASDPRIRAPVRGASAGCAGIPRFQSETEALEELEWPEDSSFALPRYGPRDLEDRTQYPFFRYMRVRKLLGICSVDHPTKILNCNELLEIADAIQDAIVSPEGQRVRPRFFGTKFQNRMLVIIVGDNTTADWVKSLPGRLKTPHNLQFLVMECIGDKWFRVRGRFRRTGNDTDEKILKYLEVQNVGIDFSKWKVVERQNEKKGNTLITFEIDWDSAERLKNRGPILNYKMGSVSFDLGEIQNMNFNSKNEDDKSVWMEASTSPYSFFGPDVSSGGLPRPAGVMPGPSGHTLQNPFSNDPGNYKRPIKNKSGAFKKFNNKSAKRRMKDKKRKERQEKQIKQESQLLPP